MNTSLSPFTIITIFAWLICSSIILMFNTAGMCSNLEIQCNEKDKQALLSFKKGVIDPSNKLSSWSTQQDCCQWEGVVCDNITSRVIELALPCFTTPTTYSDKEDKSHCLTGSINLSSLFHLEFLNYLDLYNNDFLSIQFDYYSTVDSHNNNCRNLSMASPTPPKWCVNSSSFLHHLDLSDNRDLVIDNLQWLSRVSFLEYLNLGFINLHMVTNWLQQLVTMLPSLSTLHLFNCQLKDIYPSLEHANFTALQVLNLGGNEFGSELPKWLFNLSSHISHINLASNLLRGQLPKALPNFPNLESLTLDDNNLDGQIPDWFGQLKHLRELVLDDNNFSSSIPVSLGNVSSLIVLELCLNPLTGVLFERNFAKLSNLLILCIDSNKIILEFDSHWIPPFQLEQLVIGAVSPKLPDWIYTQGSLVYLGIRNSKVSFETLDRFWNFASKIEFLDLHGNLIDGNLSNVILNSTIIVMVSNDIKDGIPRLSSNVVVADISNNSFLGSISPLLCDHNKMMNGKSNNLKYLDISSNHLTEGLTDCWNNWKSLVHINLGSNNLTGNIPQSMGLLSNLTSLHLHENNLFGEIPPSLKNCHSLLVLNVRDNKLSGNIPNWIARSAKILQLRSNQFSGNIPPHICHMSSLIILDFGDNRISGLVPRCLNNITAMVFNNATVMKLSFFIPFGKIYYFIQDSLELVTKGEGSHYKENLHLMSLVDLSNNELSGTIPPEMCSLGGLHSLNLSHNKLTGDMPKEIGNMKNLESLDFSTNKLSGEIPQSMSSLSFLGYLNLSFNNFIGQIPLGTQLQGFSALSYIGNPDLCGPPLIKSCSPPDDKSKDMKHKNKNISEFMSWFYIGIESGFVTGFLGVVGAIFLNRKWRHAYFKFLCDVRDRVYVMVAIKMNSIK